MINWSKWLQRECAAVAVAIVLAFVFAGCRTPRPLQADGLPGEQYLVGGGLTIDWKAPTAGTAYLVEKTTGKIVETRSLDAGDSYKFSVSSEGQAIEFKRAMGIELSDARFMLYFQPAGSQEPIP
jgi:hypothetical protein